MTNYKVQSTKYGYGATFRKQQRYHNRPRLRSATDSISRMYCPRLHSDDACVMAERSRGHCSQRKTWCPSAVEGRRPSAVEGSCPRAKDEVRCAKSNVTHTKARDIRIGTKATDEMQRPFRNSQFVIRTCVYAHIQNKLLVFYVD
jgi:hypothetical protein